MKKTDNFGFIVTDAPMTEQEKNQERIAMMRVAKRHKKGSAGRRYLTALIAQMY